MHQMLEQKSVVAKGVMKLQSRSFSECAEYFPQSWSCQARATDVGRRADHAALRLVHLPVDKQHLLAGIAKRAPPDEEIHRCIQAQQNAGEYQLDIARQACRVDRGQQVVFDKSARVASCAACGTQ